MRRRREEGSRRGRHRAADLVAILLSSTTGLVVTCGTTTGFAGRPTCGTFSRCPCHDGLVMGIKAVLLDPRRCSRAGFALAPVLPSGGIAPGPEMMDASHTSAVV